MNTFGVIVSIICFAMGIFMLTKGEIPAAILGLFNGLFVGLFTWIPPLINKP